MAIAKGVYSYIFVGFSFKERHSSAFGTYIVSSKRGIRLTRPLLITPQRPALALVKFPCLVVHVGKVAVVF
jgi:hypothetical protein